MTNDEIAKTLRLARLDKRISQTDLATRVGISRATVARIENGELEDSTVAKVAVCLGLRYVVERKIEVQQ